MRQLVKNLLMLMTGHAFLGAFVAELQIALRLFQTLGDFGRLDRVLVFVHLFSDQWPRSGDRYARSIRLSAIVPTTTTTITAGPPSHHDISRSRQAHTIKTRS